MGRAKIIPKDTFFLPYQTRWIKDESRLKVMEKGRQIGMSWGTAYRTVEKASLKDAQNDFWVSSRDDLQARLFLEDCKRFGAILHASCKDLGERLIDEEKRLSAYVLEMANGRRVHSMSSNPDAQAGKRGTRVLDEFALHPDPRKLWSIAYPGITWGGNMEVISTHRGSANFFAEIVREVKEKGNPKKISLHTVTLQMALDDGFLCKLQAKLGADDERQEMDEAEYFSFIRSGCVDEESFLQEYMCVPADDNSAFLTYDLIASCEYGQVENLVETFEETRDYTGRKGKIRKLGRMGPIGQMGPIYIGVDVGRDHDLTVIWVLELVGDVLHTRLVVEMGQVEFERQEMELYPLIALGQTRRVCIDNTGIGKQFAERAQKRFGEYRVERVTFTPMSKEEMAYPVKSTLEDRTTRIPFDKHVRSDFRAVKKETTAAGNIRFTAESGKNGHSDRFWAYALARHARGMGGGNPAAVTVPRAKEPEGDNRISKRRKGLWL
jgi:phage FluMu gp28-like protein